MPLYGRVLWVYSSICIEKVCVGETVAEELLQVISVIYNSQSIS